MSKFTENQIQIKLSRFFNRQNNLIIPNVSWGFFKYMEVALLIIRPSMWVDEVEIKTSKQDLLKEFSKKRYDENNKIHKKYNEGIIRHKWFCIPETILDDAKEIIPQKCGILVFNKNLKITEIRKPIKQESRKITIDEYEYMKLLRLGNLRIWTVKEQILKLKDAKFVEIFK